MTPTPPELTILVVDDDLVDRQAVVRALKQTLTSLVIVEAEDFESGRLAVLSRDFDCVVLDYNLPGGDGLHLLEEVRAVDRGVPFIVITGSGDESLAAELMRKGAADYMPKSALTATRLAQAVRHTLRVAAAERAERTAVRELERRALQLTQLSAAALSLQAAKTPAQISTLLRAAALSLVGATSAEVALNELAADSPKLPATEALLQIWLNGRDGRVLGSLTLTSANPLLATDQTLLSQLAQSAAEALENSRLVAEAQEACQQREDMLAIVSHDLRSPLSAISMAVGMLAGDLGKGTPSGERIATLVERMQRSVARMNRLIEDLLDVTRIESHQLSVVAREERGAQLLQEALEAAGSQAEAKHVTLRLGETDERLLVPADRERILQLFSNLIGNAVKFTPEGGAIELSLRRDGEAALFAVRDTGPGIPAEQLPYIFDRYFKGKATSRDGAGLGLFISRGIARAHHGSLTAANVPGSGSEFALRLPLATG